jgi:short-subunit dehydrogenase involved in D-alanine esterification of teichoic acids
VVTHNEPSPIEDAKRANQRRRGSTCRRRKENAARKQAGRGNGRAKTEVDLRVIEVPQNLPLCELRLSLKHAVTIKPIRIAVRRLTVQHGTVVNVSSALAFVPLPAAPIYSASKAAIHSHTQSLRFQLEEPGVEFIEIMPPEAMTDITAELAEGGRQLDHDG